MRQLVMRGDKVATPEKQWKQTIQLPHEGRQGKVKYLERRCGGQKLDKHVQKFINACCH